MTGVPRTKRAPDGRNARLNPRNMCREVVINAVPTTEEIGGRRTYRARASTGVPALCQQCLCVGQGGCYSEGRQGE